MQMLWDETPAHRSRPHDLFIKFSILRSHSLPLRAGRLHVDDWPPTTSHTYDLISSLRFLPLCVSQTEVARSSQPRRPKMWCAYVLFKHDLFLMCLCVWRDASKMLSTSLPASGWKHRVFIWTRALFMQARVCKSIHHWTHHCGVYYRFINGWISKACSCQTELE